MFPTISYKTKVALWGTQFLDFEPQQIAETPECCCFQEFPFSSVLSYLCKNFPHCGTMTLSCLILSQHCKQTRGWVMRLIYLGHCNTCLCMYCICISICVCVWANVYTFLQSCMKACLLGDTTHTNWQTVTPNMHAPGWAGHWSIYTPDMLSTCTSVIRTSNTSQDLVRSPASSPHVRPTPMLQRTHAASSAVGWKNVQWDDHMATRREMFFSKSFVNCKAHI